MNFKHIEEGSLKERLPTNMIIIRHQAVVHKSVMRCIYIGFTSAGRGLTRWSRGESRLIQMQEPMQPNVMQGNALCGYPLVKVAVEKICSFAPILLRFEYFRQNIWSQFLQITFNSSHILFHILPATAYVGILVTILVLHVPLLLKDSHIVHCN